MSPFADAPCEPGGRFVTIEGYAVKHRRKPLVLAIVIHVFIAMIMLLPASIFDFHRNREEVYTVNLFEALDSPPAKDVAKPPAQIKKKEEIPPPPEVKKVEAPPPVKPPVVVEKIEPVIATETESTAPAEVVSLKPRLVKKDVKPKKVEKKDEVKVDQALNRIKNELNRRQAQQKAREMQAAAAVAVDDAVSKLREAIHAQRLSSSTTSSQVSTRPSAGGGSGTSDAKLDAALKLYYVAVSQKIHEHWVLPELQEWKKDLKAVVVVEVRSDGVVTRYEFEEKSGNIYFDQFVEKTLKESLPLPPFPADLDESNLEIGLVFHPSGLQ
ncbi:MAG: TonB C-terminal domain-containing protein [Proteobacteria bacterium]|nr:TonB C-terminal domain-containing protein [Pseudomonadota bacterium]MBU4298259.1 TonB C-terminal domain-containing protein [Pseudomonadota bacterium]MCG2747527.1 TonB C-terminal domain-containing protein [Desulfobulbaceae bacterium]